MCTIFFRYFFDFSEQLLLPLICSAHCNRWWILCGNRARQARKSDDYYWNCLVYKIQKIFFWQISSVFCDDSLLNILTDGPVCRRQFASLHRPRGTHTVLHIKPRSGLYWRMDAWMDGTGSVIWSSKNHVFWHYLKNYSRFFSKCFASS